MITSIFSTKLNSNLHVEELIKAEMLSIPHIYIPKSSNIQIIKLQTPNIVISEYVSSPLHTGH